MNTAEKISALEALLVRVQQRAGEPRPKREHPPVVVASAPVEVSTPIAGPPAVEAVQPPKVEAPKVEAPVVVAAVPPPTAAKPIASPSGSYVAKGGMSEELPDFTLEDEEEEGDESQQDAELVIEQDASSSDEEGEAEELDIPSRQSVASLKSVDVRAPIELDTTTDEEIEIDRAPLASAVPSAADEATARELERLPGIQMPGDSGLDLEVSPASIAPPPAIPLIVPKAVAVPAPITPAPSAIASPAPTPAVVAPPSAVVLPPAPPVVAPAVVAPPTPVAPPATAAVVAPVVAPAVAPVVAKPTVAAPVVHEPAPLPDAPAIVSEGALAAPAPTTFAGMLRRSLSLRVRG